MSLLLPGLLILGVLVAIGAGLWITLMNVRRSRREIERRVSLVASAAGNASVGRAAAMKKLRESGWSLALGVRMRGFFALGLPRNWGMKASGLALIIAMLVGAGASWLVLHSVLHLSNLFAPPLCLVATFLAPRTLLKHQQTGADKEFTEVFPDAIDMVIRMLRAGLPVGAAVRSVGEEAPPPVNEIFTSLADQMAIGISFEDALTDAGETVGLSDFKFFAVAISLQRATGGNLATTLDILSDLMRKRRAVRMKARATTGEVRMSAYILAAIPFLVIGGLLIMTPDYLNPLIHDPRGKVIIAVAVASLVSGFAIIRQMMLSVTRAI